MDKKLWCIYTMEYLAIKKKNLIWFSRTEVDEPRACYTEGIKSEEERNIIY